MLRLFCDGCGVQNKNLHIIHCLMFWLVNESPENIKEIYLTFPVRALIHAKKKRRAYPRIRVVTRK